MRSVKVGVGQVTITDETIQIDQGPIRVLKRLYEQSKLLIAFIIIGSLCTIIMAIFESSPLREFAQITIIFVIIGIPLATLYPKIRNNIENASEICRVDIRHIKYTTGSRLSAPKLRIIVDDGVATGVRTVPLSHRRLGGDQQLEAAIQAFEDAGIEIVPTDETPDEDG